MDLRAYKTIQKRRKALEKETKISLQDLGLYSSEDEKATFKNCENMIGAVRVPLGVAGPLTIQSANFGTNKYFLPLATTEGALVASVSRGSKVISENGGALVSHTVIGITRAPVFAVKSVADAQGTINWLSKSNKKLQQLAQKVSSHLHLLNFQHWIVGNNLFIRFLFDSENAMGMNMATIAVTEIAKLVEKETPAKLIAISSNMCVDKKSNMLNFINGRGIKVWAQSRLSRKSIEVILKTTPEKILEVITKKLYLGSILSGSIGANAHAANVLAAIFLATGQDLAHIAEVSSVVTTGEVLGKDLSISVYLPDLVVGTVGGGTGLPTQRKSLELLGVREGSSKRFAEIIGAAVLAGEISLLASISENSLAKAHSDLARGGK